MSFNLKSIYCERKNLFLASLWIFMLAVCVGSGCAWAVQWIVTLDNGQIVHLGESRTDQITGRGGFCVGYSFEIAADLIRQHERPKQRRELLSAKWSEKQYLTIFANPERRGSCRADLEGFRAIAADYLADLVIGYSEPVSTPSFFSRLFSSKDKSHPGMPAEDGKTLAPATKGELSSHTPVLDKETLHGVIANVPNTYNNALIEFQKKSLIDQQTAKVQVPHNMMPEAFIVLGYSEYVDKSKGTAEIVEGANHAFVLLSPVFTSGLIRAPLLESPWILINPWHSPATDVTKLLRGTWLDTAVINGRMAPPSEDARLWAALNIKLPDVLLKTPADPNKEFTQKENWDLIWITAAMRGALNPGVHPK